MRVAISGTANTGKSTLVNDFLNRWSNYRTPMQTYRQIVENNKDKHSDKTTQQVQEDILDFMIKTQCQYTPEDNVLFDRCTLDNLAYTLGGIHRNMIPGSYGDIVIPLIRESLRNIDIIFLVRYDPAIPIVNDGIRCVDEQYIKEIDAIFGLIYEDYLKNNDETYTLFPKDDMPAIIEIRGTRQQRLAQIAEYIDPFGSVIETAPEESVLSDSQLKQMEELLKNQEKFALQDKWGVK
jgi:nicotinamide riboside kinase